MEELRRHRRLQVPLQVEVRHPFIGTLEVPAADISDGGIFIKVDECFQLELAESVIVRTLGLGPNADEIGPPLVMKVVRKTADGMGLSIEESASENLKSLSGDPNSKHSVLQSLFLVNSNQQVLFTMQGDHWRLPSRELGCSESWQQGIDDLVKSIEQTGGLDPNNDLKIEKNCYPQSMESSPSVELLIPAYVAGDVVIHSEEPQLTTSENPVPAFSWFSSLDIRGMNTAIDASLVDKLLSQV